MVPPNVCAFSPHSLVETPAGANLSACSSFHAPAAPVKGNARKKHGQKQLKVQKKRQRKGSPSSFFSSMNESDSEEDEEEVSAQFVDMYSGASQFEKAFQ